jgi:hypothetical protein
MSGLEYNDLAIVVAAALVGPLLVDMLPLPTPAP